MRSASDRDAADLTLRSRIRDAAVRLFGRDGFAVTTVRAVAAEAGASPALVLHHFGSKEGLRRETDAHVVGLLMGRNSDMVQEATRPGGASALMREWLADVGSYRVELDYLARMLHDGSPAGDALFDALVVETQAMLESGADSGMFTRFGDPHAVAVLVTAQSVMPLLMERQIGRAFGTTGLDAATIRRITVPTLELYTHGLYADETVLEAAKAALERPHPPSSGKGPADPTQDPDPPSAPASAS